MPKASKEELILARDEMLTISQVIEEIRIPRATFYRWRQLRKGPKSIKLPNGAVRIRRSELERWIASLEEMA
ncbi:helix-turn-helix domain-containing protein [Streptomyces sp. NPDC002766]|uniref:helix-turn-helix transcriptional regulator n=1 Tax=Streptomyces sp. NPDC002766 TaxID=3154429 RepID=UPI00332C5FD2